LADFDFVAPFYQLLSKFIFFGKLSKSNLLLAKWSNQHTTILVLGGGNGEILTGFKKGQKIDFVDSSSVMISLAKKRKCAAKASFIEANFLSYSFSHQYDAIICPYFLDVFPEEQLDQVLQKIYALLNVDSSLLVADFYPNNANWIRKQLLAFMFLFFRLMSNLENKKYNHLFEKIEQRYILVREFSFSGRFIRSCEFRKPT
jgi:ubiquinone/menaquinone biosynthesis C-methylase UbiE